MSSKKKASSKKKEVLDDPSTVKSGTYEWYIGGWSSHKTVECVTDISNELIASHTNEKREVEPLPRTNVMILVQQGEHEDAYSVELADKLHLEGVSNHTVKKSVANEKNWERPPELAAATAEGEQPPQEGEAPKEEGEEAAAAPPPPPVETPVVEEKEEADTDPYTSSIGADGTSRHVQIHGAVALTGVTPQIVVQPQLPEAPKTEGAAGGTKKGGKKKKITAEEQEALDRQKAEEEANYLKETEKAIALAKEQEDYLMTFAHPDRWANVEIVNVTFTGPVTVRRAHITFRNCVFVSRSTAVPQLNVTQYCKVSCVKCTFEAPLHSSLYTFPQAQVSVLKCLFTGVPQRLVMKELPAIQEKNDEEEHGGKAAADVLLTPALQEAFQLMQSQQPATVAVYYDGSASLSVDKCRVLCYGTGVLLRGHCSSDRSASPTVSVTKSAFHHLCNTALLVEGNARDVLVKENQVSDCAYYGLDCRSGAKEIKVTKNNFSVGAAVRLRENSSAQLLHNNFHSIPIDDNKADNPNHAPKY